MIDCFDGETMRHLNRQSTGLFSRIGFLDFDAMHALFDIIETLCHLYPMRNRLLPILSLVKPAQRSNICSLLSDRRTVTVMDTPSPAHDVNAPHGIGAVNGRVHKRDPINFRRPG